MSIDDKNEMIKKLLKNQHEQLLKMHRSECRDQIDCNCYELNKKEEQDRIWYNKIGNCTSGGSIMGPYQPPSRPGWKRKNLKKPLWKRILYKILAAISYIIPIHFFKKYRIPDFLKLVFPIVRRTFPSLIANQIVTVQKMESPPGLVFQLDNTGKRKDEKPPDDSCF